VSFPTIVDLLYSKAYGANIWFIQVIYRILFEMDF
jgi:hypothetical protein